MYKKLPTCFCNEQHHHADTHRLKDFITPPRLHIQTCTLTVAVSGTSVISKLLCTLLPLWGRPIVSLVPDSSGQTDVQFWLFLAQTPTGLSSMLWRRLDTPIINTVEYENCYYAIHPLGPMYSWTCSSCIHNTQATIRDPFSWVPALGISALQATGGCTETNWYSRKPGKKMHLWHFYLTGRTEA